MLIEPNGPSRAYDTYGVIAPKATHTRKALCAEVNQPCASCPEWHCGATMHGWQTMCDVATEIGQRRARYIIDHSERRWTAEQDGGLVTFTFPPGQQCFADHRIALDREPLFTLKRGDYRTHVRPAIIDGSEWIDRFANNQIKLKETHDRG